MKPIIRSFVCILIPLFASAQNQAGASGAQPATSSADPVQVIGFLSETISWYRHLAVEQQLATEPADLAFVQEDRSVADEVVRQAFDYARQQANARTRRATSSSPAQAQDTQRYQALTQAAEKTQQQINDTQAELQATRQKLSHTAAAQQKALQAQAAELEAEVGLLQARGDAFQSMLEFVSSSNSATNGTGLRAQIDDLGRSVPAALSRPENSSSHESETPETAASTSTSTQKPESNGIWGLVASAIHLSGKMHSLDDQSRATADLSRDAAALRQPSLDQLRTLMQQGDSLFAAADTATPAQLAQQKQQLDDLTAQFKQISAVMLPLGKIGILLDSYQATLKNWRESVKDDLRDDLRQLFFRLGVLVVLIAIVIGLGEVWRRTTFRYVHEPRRRYQFLLIRRIVIWTTIGIIVILTFASQLGSAVTFAGLLTAGIAVALQNVIVSIVAYFFLIGKYGIRVGDRIQIAGVTGEVVELGLVRIHLMELDGPGNSQPTGRTVAFSNSIVFQPTSGVFRQIPGTSFIWHELKLTLAADTDFHTARERISKAAETALEGYRDTMDAQHAVMARNLASVSPAQLRPKVRLHYDTGGVEVTINFPVDFQKASEMDDRMMKEVMAALGQSPKIRLLGAEAPLAKAGD